MNTSPVKIWRRQKDIRQLLGKRGEVISYTRIFTPPVGHRKNAPYSVVLVKMGNGSRVIGQIADCDPATVALGMKVVSTLRKVREGGQEDVIMYGLKFIPV